MKITNIVDYTVIVEVENFGKSWKSNERYLAEKRSYAEEMINEIKRHVDNVDHVYIETEYEAVCEHCGSGWTEEDSNYNGGCCDKDEENNPDNEDGK